jgi:hypothetical protein
VPGERLEMARQLGGGRTADRPKTAKGRPDPTNLALCQRERLLCFLTPSHEVLGNRARAAGIENL